VLLGIIDLARAGVLALAVPLLSALIVLRSRVQIANRRSAEPPRAVAGDTVVVHLTISNRSLLPTGSLMLEDQLPGQLRGNARFAIDGLLGRESRTVSYRMPRLPRGRYRAGPLHIRLTDSFHLIDVRRSFTATNEIVIAPVIDAIRNVEPPRSLDVGDDAGSHSIGVRGADDASTREYRTGDDLRKIHWRSSARTGALMVRQEERPWQGQMTVLLDLRRTAHVERPARADGDDERLTSSLEWAISAAASVATHAIMRGREVGLIADLSAPMRLPMGESSNVAEYLATVRASSLGTLEPFEGLLGPLTRETTLVAVVGRLDQRSLHALATVHPRGSSTHALALLLDTDSWTKEPGAEPSRDPDRYDIDGIARILRAAGWQVQIARCGDAVGASLQTLLSSRGASAQIAVAARR
jgi:uncharacterized protein (DUF58 family)